VFRRARLSLVVRALALLLVAAQVGCGSPAATPPVEGVSSLSYSPKPLHNDLRSFEVRFTTRGPAQEGLEYYAGIVIDSLAGERGCSFLEVAPPEGSRQHVEGAPGRTYTVVMRADAGGRFCAGRATLAVGTARPSDGRGGRQYRKVTFRILRRR
jgi:hypothetical protein